MYRALYRKWRPQTFDEVYGQSHVTKTLKNEIANNRISHAYLFTGTRGTGKTTCARILTKAVNCLNPQDGNPCNECEICKGVDDGSIFDIVEIDAASNNSVDNIRDLREEVNFTPAVAKYRVYIIDEVHMLSTGAFNALLKTLEEPPAHVIFILATTELHKLPATILSRCQRFDFNRISPEEIIACLKKVAQGENVRIDDEAANLIAELSDGGMRDALSLMDRCLSVSDNITDETVSTIAGIASNSYMFSFSSCIAENDCAKALGLINELNAGFCDMDRIIMRLQQHFRNIMVAAGINNCENLIICSAAELEKYKQEANKIRMSRILECISILSQTASEIKIAPNKKILLETAVIKMCNAASKPAEGYSPEVDKRLSVLEDKINSILSSGIQIDPGRAFENETKPEKKPEEETEPVTVKKETKLSPVVSQKPVKTESETSAEPVVPVLSDFTDGPFKEWPEVLSKIKKSDIALYGLLAQTETFIKDGKLVIKTENETLYDFITEKDNNRIHYVNLARAIFDVTGKKVKIAVSSAKASEPVNKDRPIDILKKKIDDFNQGE